MNNKPGLEMRYFVLKPRGTDLYAAAAREAIRVYACAISRDNPTFAKDLREWADEEYAKAQEVIRFQNDLDSEDD